MFALVRFIEDDVDKRQYVIPVADIEDFDPADENDFSNRTAYRCKWHDPDNDANDGTYTIQILRLADTEDDMKEKMRQKRVNIPPINLSDLENESNGDDLNVSQKKKVLRQESKKKRSNRAASKKQQFDDVLRQHAVHALQSNAAVSNRTSPVKARVPDSRNGEPQRNDKVTPTASQSANKRKWSNTSSTSGSDDGLVPENEVRVAMKEAKFWKAQYRLQCEHNATLKKEVLFLRDTVKAQLNSFKDMLEQMPRTRVDTGVAVASVERQRSMATSEMISGCMHGQRTAAPLQEAVGISSSLDSATTDNQGNCSRGGMSAAPVESHFMVEDVGPEANEAHADGMHDNVAEFAPTADGRFHLCKGVIISAEQASKIFSNKKPTIVVRDCAQAIWGLDALAHRTVSGRSVPGEETKQLTPEKVHVVNECLAYWGKEKKQDVTVASHGLQRILSEKIQDVKKKIKQGKA